MEYLTDRQKYDLIGMLSVSIRNDEIGLKEVQSDEALNIINKRLRERKETLQTIKKSF